MGRFENFKENIQERFAPKPEDYEAEISERVPFIADLKLDKDELAWIAEVKKGSEEFATKTEKEGRTPGKTAFDYIELHLMMLKTEALRQSDPFSKRKEYLEKQLDEKTGKIIKDILEKYDRELNAEHHWKGYEKEDVEATHQRLVKAQTLKEKLTAISLYLNLIHHGGSRHEIPEGYVTEKKESKFRNFGDVALTQRNFLRNLNELGNRSYWEKRRQMMKNAMKL